MDPTQAGRYSAHAHLLPRSNPHHTASADALAHRQRAAKRLSVSQGWVYQAVERWPPAAYPPRPSRRAGQVRGADIDALARGAAAGVDARPPPLTAVSDAVGRTHSAGGRVMPGWILERHLTDGQQL